MLYNGIRLPQEWPPWTLDPQARVAEPPPLPYLAAPPAVIPIDVGRQLTMSLGLPAPQAPEAFRALDLFASGGTAVAVSLVVHELASIWATR